MKIASKDSTEKIVYFVCHGQSEHNAAPVFQAEESQLSQKGIKQAQDIASRFSNLSVDALISSPIKRAKQTANEISKTIKTPIEFSDLFIERTTPMSMRGKPHTDAQANATWRAWENSFVTDDPGVENAENFADIMLRANAALKFLYEHPGKTFVVVTHGFFLRALVAKVLLGSNITPQSFGHFQSVVSTENTGVTALIYEADFEQDPCWHLWVYNDHSHLIG